MKEKLDHRALKGKEKRGCTFLCVKLLCETIRQNEKCSVGFYENEEIITVQNFEAIVCSRIV